MDGESSGLPPQDRRPPVAPSEALSKPDPAQTGAAQLEGLQLESLVLNLDASLRVHARSHFFSWTQGLLQSLIRHEVLICALCTGAAPLFRVESFSAIVPDATIFSDLLLRDASVAVNLIRVWKERHFEPVIRDAGEGEALCGGLLERELLRVGIAQVLAHGTHGVDGEAGSFFIFACQSNVQGAAARERQAYLARLVVPFLHAAWVRSQIHETVESDRPSAAEAGVLTPREQEILRWIYLGKSNGEVGSILGISPLTVKNHVQKLLRKLNVVNRTQAVGKALDARIIKP